MASAPSGANQQPWRFVVVANPEIKRRIREEREKYDRRFPDERLQAIEPLGTDRHKEFLQTAPYYMMESVGIAVGFLLCALHLSGLATLTHTPNPMGFLREFLVRPINERPYGSYPWGTRRRRRWCRRSRRRRWRK